ncbi:hypothetical protein HJC23_001286 [Cyclotella cryptica]|uniref:Plastid lipid-associated protein/fibrillin conserved domain-containing protein n=1 Tax=Cyclotella cryptica TaxID=29204 RepID=A0ABD3P9M2_9STRA|eukprot:CCRYP_016528-RE/>CCRYP_016528-RE protein AED:0.34 eAED:0.34 QI:314/1/1/1/1/1/3/73/308
MTAYSSVSILAIAIASLSLPSISSFTLQPKRINIKSPQCHAATTQRKASSSACFATNADVPQAVKSATDQIEDCKRGLVRMCDAHVLGSGYSSEIEGKIEELEKLGQEADFGQASSLSGLVSGEWELIYASDDITRSSPFFWAFRRAFPDSSDQIFGITDAIPAPIKMVGPATQIIDVDSSSRPVSGTFVSRVKVATLGGIATSTMTTRCTVLSADGSDGLRLRVESTKPEESTILQKLGPLGDIVDSSTPPFPSGEALERVAPGSSEVVVRTTYCDEGLRVSRNDDRVEDVFVWKRVKFGSGSTVSL